MCPNGSRTVWMSRQAVKELGTGEGGWDRGKHAWVERTITMDINTGGWALHHRHR